MKEMTITIVAHPGVGKTRLINNAIRPWCEENEFAYVDGNYITDAALTALRRTNDKICIVKELTPSMVKNAIPR